MKLIRLFYLACLVFCFSSCDGGDSSDPIGGGTGGVDTGIGGGTGGGVSSSELVVISSTGDPNPGAIIFLKAVSNAVDNINYDWTSSCVDVEFYPNDDGLMLNEENSTSNIVWMKVPNSTNHNCIVRADGTSPSMSYSGFETINTRPNYTSDWLSYQGSSENTGRASSGDLGPPPSDLNQVWKLSGENPGPVSPALSSEGAGGRVIISEAEGLTRAFDANSGTQLWAEQLSENMIGNPVIGDGTIMVASQTGTIKALDLASGNYLWGTNIGSSISGTPAYSYGVLVVGTLSGKLVGLTSNSCLTCGTNRVLWETELQGRIVGGVSIFDGIIGDNASLSDLNDATAFVGTDAGFLYAVRLSDGQIMHTWSTSDPITTTPAVFLLGAQPTVAVATEGGDVWMWDAIDPYEASTSLNPFFSTNSPVVTSPVYFEGDLYFFLRDSRDIAVDPGAESLIESTFLPAASPDAQNLTCLNTPAVSSSSTSYPYLYMTCFEILVEPDPFTYGIPRGLLLMLSRNDTTGEIEELERYPIGTDQMNAGQNSTSDPIISSPSVMGGKVFFTGQDGSVYALGEEPTFDFGDSPLVWASKRGNSSSTGFYGSGPGMGSVQERWNYRMPAGVSASPSISNGTLWLGDLDGNLVGLRAADGMYRFSYNIGGNEILTTPILMDNGLVWATSLTGLGYLLKENGDQLEEVGRLSVMLKDRWEDRFSNESVNLSRKLSSNSSAYDSVNRVIYIPMINNCEFDGGSFSLCDGVHWSQDLEMQPTDDLMIGQLMVDDLNNISLNKIEAGLSIEQQAFFNTSLGIHTHAGKTYLVAGYYAGGVGRVTAWDVSDPENVLPLWGGSVLLGSNEFPTGVPTFIENRVLFGTTNGSLWVLNLESEGGFDKSIQLGFGSITNSISVSFNENNNEGFIFAPIENGRLVAQPFIMANNIWDFNGTSLDGWNNAANDFVRSSLALDEEHGVIYIGGDDGNLFRYEKDSGFRLAGTIQTGSPIFASPIIVGGYVFLIDSSGLLSVYSP